MQLATSVNNKPWCCTVYYLTDDKLNLYWASLPTRRHSKEIDINNLVSCAIKIKSEIGQKVIGVQVQGKAFQLKKYSEILPIAVKYTEKFKRGKTWAEQIASSKTEHKIYKLVPDYYQLFDEEHYPESSPMKYVVE